MMQSRQIILANEPRLLRSMFHRVFDKIHALEIAGEVGDLAKLPSLVDETEAHWIFVSLSAEGRMPDHAQSLLQSHPSLGIVGVAQDGSLVKIQGAGHAEMTASTWSLDQLVAALCQQPALSTGGM